MESKLTQRPDPDNLLNALKRQEEQARKGKLKIFFGMCAGVGKTYDMLKAAHTQMSKGIDVVIGIVETHMRRETEVLLEGLPVVQRKAMEYKGTVLEEMDLDAILARAPALVLVDELAHTNAPGSRHTKRYQDVLELLENGIDVYSTLNVQHLESRADTVAQITGTIVRETVPDSILDVASEVELVDIPPDELVKRLEEGKVYTAERSRQAIQNFFRKGNLTALREMALRLTAERVDHQLREFMSAQGIAGPWKSGQRLIVGISASPHSVSLIRWARRTAYTMDASWIVVYVESSTPLKPEARDQLAKNIALARELGAEIVTTADEDVVAGLMRVAKEQNATQLLIGKTSHFIPFRRSRFDRLVALSGDLDIVVVGGNKAKHEWTAFRLPAWQSPVLHYLQALGIVFGLAGLCYPLSVFIGYQTVSLVLLFAVALLSLKFGIGPVIGAAAMSALLWNYFFIPPAFTFAIDLPQDMLMFAAYFVIAAVTGLLTTRIRARERAVRVREEHAVALFTLTKELSVAHTLDDVVEVAVKNFKRFFDADVVVCLSESDGDLLTKPHPASSLVIDEKDFSVAAWVYWNERRAGRFTETLPSVDATYYPCSGPRYPLGVIGVKRASNQQLNIEQDTLLENFIGQISSSLEREQLNELTRKTLVVAESERLYKNLFESISHEFKTPIATILGSAEHLMDSGRVDEKASRELAQEIYQAGSRLNHFVANLLDMTRLESGSLKPKLDWCDLSDIIRSTVQKHAGELSRHYVSIEVDAAAPLIKLDPGLMEQVLWNLLNNATLYTPAGTHITIAARVENDSTTITVCDDGPGIPPESSEKIFQKFYRVPGNKSGGTGLGLSISRGFVEAQGGKLTLVNRPAGGACFAISLPAATSPANHVVA